MRTVMYLSMIIARVKVTLTYVAAKCAKKNVDGRVRPCHSGLAVERTKVVDKHRRSL
jgi:hypothetical protein